MRPPLPPLEPPNVELDFRDKMMVKVGDPCTLSGCYSGKPVPTIAWKKNDEELKADEEISFHSTTHHLSVNISKAKREHSGRYGVTVENAAGSRTGLCTITVVGESLCHRISNRFTFFLFSFFSIFI